MKATRTILSVFLALLVMISSTSFMVGKHLCMGEVQNVAIFTKADGCEKEKELPPCHRHLKAPCCEDETLIHKADDAKNSAANAELNTPAPADVEQVLVLISDILPTAPAAQTQFYNYDPPSRSCDLTVEHRVFLI